jgi:diguanylate cyclase (GGDEF)-like protein/PAS domain S-box-containing protein
MIQWRSAISDSNKLARRLLVALIFFSSLVTTLITAGELYLRYRTEVQQVQTGFSFIADIYQPALAESVWVLDGAQVNTQLNGLLRMPNIEYLAISVGDKVQWSAGRRTSTRQITRRIPLIHGTEERRRTIGELEVVASEDHIYDVLLDELLHVLVGNALKTTLVAFFMLLVFQALVNRHLLRLGQYLKTLTPATLDKPFVLERSPSTRWRPDILDQVAEAVNKMVVDLRSEVLRSGMLTGQLRKNEAMFRAIFAEAGAAIVLIDSDTLQVLEINDTGCSILGYSREEALALRFTDYQVDFSEAHLRELIPLIEESGAGRFISRHRRKDGVFIDVDISVRPLLLEGRRMLLDVWRDVTEQKAIERTLAATRDELRLMAEAVPVAVFRYQVVDNLMHVIYISPPIERLSGLKPDTILGNAAAFADLVDRTDLEQMRETQRKAWDTHTAFSATVRITRPDGQVRWLTMASEPRDEGVSGTIWYGYIHDVTERELSDQALRSAQSRFKATVDFSPLGVVIARLNDGRAILTNDNLQRLFGWSREELSNLPTTQTIWPSAESRDHWLEELKVDGNLVDYETRFRCKDGRLADVSMSATIVELEQEPCILGFIADIGDRVIARESQRRAASVFAHSLEGIIIADADRRILDVNPAFTAITGYERDEVIGKTPKVLSSGRQSAEFYQEMWHALEHHDFWRGELWNRRKSGEIFAEMQSIATVRNESGEVTEYISVFSDISRIKAHEEELDRIAHYDSLTGLPNRRLLGDRMQLAVSRAKREGNILAVCFLDLDGFKAINDEHGHASGDQVLLAIARALSVTLRGGDTLARLGGDEFVLLFGDVATVEECQPMLRRILDIIATPIRLPVQSAYVTVSASIGVTLYPSDSGDADTLMRHADQAMYRAKELGKNRFHFFDPESDKRISAHREALLELEQAFAQREFELFYQPKIDLRNGEVIGAEALIRWRKADGTLVPPASFLPHMEGEDLEIRVSEWVITTAYNQLRTFAAAGLKIQVSANLVASHLTQPGFLSWMRELLLLGAEFRPGDFNLEILESAAIGDVDVVAEQLAAVRAMGISLSLDDFGTGYSSLAYFRRLPIDTLKIDQGFVRDMLSDASDHNIVESVIRLADVFDRRVIAEGVETLDHWRELLSMGCYLGQGYGIARPMPVGDFLPWVERWRSGVIWQQVLAEVARDNP